MLTIMAFLHLLVDTTSEAKSANTGWVCLFELLWAVRRKVNWWKMVGIEYQRIDVIARGRQVASDWPSRSVPQCGKAVAAKTQGAVQTGPGEGRDS